MRTKHPLLLTGAAILAIGAACSSAWADRIKNPIAVFAGLDKITGRVVTFEAKINEIVQFGLLQIKTRACYTRPPTEAPETVSFLQVDEITPDKKRKRIFSGWMFAASPGLNGIEHPVYDVWLLNCKGGTQVIPSRRHEADLPQSVPAAKPLSGGDKAPGFASKPSSPAPALRGSAGPGVAPPFTGPPIEVGAAPGEEGPTTPPAQSRGDEDDPAVAVPPPGPLPPVVLPGSPPPRDSGLQQDDPDDRNPY